MLHCNFYTESSTCTRYIYIEHPIKLLIIELWAWQRILKCGLKFSSMLYVQLSTLNKHFRYGPQLYVRSPVFNVVH